MRGGDLVADVDLSELDYAIYQFAAALEKDLPWAVRKTAKALNLDLMKLTPPKNHAQGRKAVARDISRAVMLIDPAKTFSWAIRQAILDREYEVVQAFMRSTGWMSGKSLRPFTPDLHSSVRDNRGRVQRPKHVITLDVPEHRKYVKMVQGHVGSTKKWWAVSASVLGNPVPAWVNRHSVKGTAVIDHLNVRDNPSITMINRGAGAGRIDRHLIVNAVRRRAAAMLRDIDRILKGGAHKHFES